MQFVPSPCPESTCRVAPSGAANSVIGPAADAAASVCPSGDQSRSIT